MERKALILMFLITLLHYFVRTSPLFGQIPLSGALQGRLAGVEYSVEGDISVEIRQILVVEPGADFSFVGNYTFTVRGLLTAIGTADDSIRFYPAEGVASWGGIDFLGSDTNVSTLRYCVITQSNSSGITCIRSNPIISHCTITQSEGYIGRGGAIHCFDYSSPTIENCNILNNWSDLDGGGIFCSDFSNTRILDCIVTGNSSEYGGGIYANYSPTTINNCIIYDNDAGWWGGGIYCFDAHVFIQNCLIYDNSCGMTGGGITIRHAYPTIINCTIAENSAVDGGSGVHVCYDAVASMTNTIIANNHNEGILFEDSTLATINYCDIYNNSPSDLAGEYRAALGVLAGMNVNHDPCDIYFNIRRDPMFVAAEERNYRLTPHSPCIDAGDPGGAADPDGTVADIGAMRYNHGQQGILTLPLQGHYFELISTYLVPQQRRADILFGGIDNLAIVYQDDGGIYLPPNLNTIGDITITRAYSLFCYAQSEWTVDGTYLERTTEYSITGGRWNWVGYPFSIEVPVETALASIEEELRIVINDQGRLWIPSIPINTLYTLRPGEGYRMFTTEDVTFQYDLWTMRNSFLPRECDPDDQYGETVVRTGLPFAVIVYFSESVLSSEPAKLELYDGKIMVGESLVSEDRLITPASITGQSEKALPVIAWEGSDYLDLPGFTPAHEIKVKLKSSRNEELPIEASSISQNFDHIPRFGRGGFAEIQLEKPTAPFPNDFSLYPPYPNPFNNMTRIRFDLPKTGVVYLAVYNTVGQEVARLVAGTIEAGVHTVEFNDPGLSSGIYFVFLRSGSLVKRQKIVLLK